ncbi:hypothetical protein BKA70DRAFT_1216831 [Coprinopsis sp. MPI-PUGE-AT-0042]|nr:hypothetical protein BKA70DRAFT_1216831 [Coprinopsis sp. MPI-PUGE-AT-0042]
MFSSILLVSSLVFSTQAAPVAVTTSDVGQAAEIIQAPDLHERLTPVGVRDLPFEGEGEDKRLAFGGRTRRDPATDLRDTRNPLDLSNLDACAGAIIGVALCKNIIQANILSDANANSATTGKGDAFLKI